MSYSYTQRQRTGLSINSHPSTLNISYAWDGTKRLTNVTSGAGRFGYGYRASQPTLVSKVALPYGHYETNTYDALGRLTGTALANSGNAMLNDHAYTLNVGNQRIVQARGGVGYTNTVDYGYDPIGQLLSAVGKEINGTNRLQEQFGYAYDAGGNLKSRTNNALVQSFTVDTLNQLTNVSRTGTLTVAGNTTSKATNVTVNALTAVLYADTAFARTNFSVTDGTNSYTAIAEDSYGRLDTNAISVWLPASANYSYDLNGNLTFDGRKAFEYDDENQLVRVTRTNEWKTEFVYDGKMRMRIKKEFVWQSGIWNQQSEIRYVYDGMLVVQERDANNQPQVTYTRGRDLSGTFEGAGGIGGLLARSQNSITPSLLSTAFYHADGNGNITALMSTNGLIVAWYQYDAYGRTLAQSGPLAEANCYRFSSKAWQEKAGLYYYGYRFYTPDLQRWVNRDPIGEAGFEVFESPRSARFSGEPRGDYIFVNNNPANAFDSFGLFRFSKKCKPGYIAQAQKEFKDACAKAQQGNCFRCLDKDKQAAMNKACANAMNNAGPKVECEDNEKGCTAKEYCARTGPLGTIHVCMNVTIDLTTSCSKLGCVLLHEAAHSVGGVGGDVPPSGKNSDNRGYAIEKCAGCPVDAAIPMPPTY